METQIICSTVTSIVCSTACGQRWGAPETLGNCSEVLGCTRKHLERFKNTRDGVFPSGSECIRAAPSVTGAPPPLATCGTAYHKSHCGTNYLSFHWLLWGNFLWYTSALDYKHSSGTNYAHNPRYYCIYKYSSNQTSNRAPEDGVCDKTHRAEPVVTSSRMS